MVEFFTMLYFTYNITGVPLELQGNILFRTQQECAEATESDIFDMIYSEEIDRYMWCESTGIMSSTPRPNYKPASEENKKPNA